MAGLKLTGVGKTYGGAVNVLNNIDLDIEQGELIVFVGPSGCGKSTLLRMIAGLESITDGSLEIDGLLVNDVPPAQRGIAMVFQSYALFPHMSVMENVAYGLGFSGFDKSETKDRAVQGLDLVGLKGYGDRLPSELSGGQQQRVAVARALVLEPQVLLFDEPLSNLDAKLRRQVREEIREIQQNLGLTVVYVTHDQEEALAVSDEIVVMYNAGIAQIGSPRDLYDAPADRFVADFIGEANIISCEIVAVSGDTATINIAGFIHTLPSRGLSVGPAQLAVRPTRLIMNAPSGITVTVQKATYVGSRMEYTLKAEFGTLFSVSENVDEPLKVGQSLAVGLDKIGPVLLPKI